MKQVAPLTGLGTHEVSNQPSPFANVNLYATDRALVDAVQREAGDWLHVRADGLGKVVGSTEVLTLGEDANRNPPILVSFDRYGQRLDEVRFHPSYHALMGLAMDHGIHDIAWRENRPGRHVAHAALLAVFTQAEAGVMCPMNMTYAAVPALRGTPDISKNWLSKLIGGRYESGLRPIADKAGITLGMAMTEKQGGSDVRANTTRAHSFGDGHYRLTGHKWFCSAPMSDGFLTLAYADGGLTCFLVPRVTPDGQRNGIRLMRLKDKLGNRSNASAELEYVDAIAMRLGEEGHGIKTIIDMVHHTRLGTIAGTLGIMRMSLAQAVHHARERRVFQKSLIDQPVMAAVLADLAVEYEAAVVLVMHVARAFEAGDEAGRAYARLAVALAKYWLTKRCANFTYECMECLGGAGYIEEGAMPRLYREAPLNAIWEGSGNVIALDILRTLRKEPLALDRLEAELTAAGPARQRKAITAARDAAAPEARARGIAEGLALALQDALLTRHAPTTVADAFSATRFGEDIPRSFGAGAARMDVSAVLARQLP